MAELPLSHVAIIMDGNGRWARQRGLERTAGHAAGEEALFDVVEGAVELGLAWLTVYAFSTENWKRPSEEVEFLMLFNESLLLRRRQQVHELGVRVRFIGEQNDPRIPASTQARMAETIELTASNRGTNLVFAFNYGSRVELAHAAQALATEVAAGRLALEKIDEAALAAGLYLPELPDPDLVIRTSGEQRISNFLLWQAAYAELYFTDVLWPDFRREHLQAGIAEFARRRRRFGAV